MRKLLIIGIAIMLTGAFMVACDENATTPDSALGTVTFNLSAPYGEDATGATAAVSLWSTWGANTAVYIEDGVFANNTLTIQIPDVGDGTYIAVAAIDANGDGFPSDGPADAGDLFWAGLDVVISGNKTIAVTAHSWQWIEENTILIGVKGIPTGHDGQVFASGIFEDSTDILATPEMNVIYGGVGLIYNNSAVLALTPDGDSSVTELTAGNYDIWMLVDADGQIETWQDSTGNDNPFSDGDLLAKYDYAYNPATYDAPLINATFTELSLNTLTFNITVPDGENLDGNSALAFLFTSSEAEEPSDFQEAIISGGTATITFDVSSSWVMLGAIVLDVDGNGFDPYSDGPPMDPGDFFWGALNLSASTDLVVNIPSDGWQEYEGFHFVGVDGIPSGHDGEVLAIGFVPDAGNPFNPYNHESYMNGAGLIYNNSAIVTMHANTYGDTSWALPYGNYDIYSLIDVDGSISDYHNINDSTMFTPVTNGDYYYKYDYSYTDMQSTDDFVNITGSFAPVIGISGTVSCPTWVSGYGDTYIYLFKENPLQSDSAETYSGRVLTQPGAYWLPCFPGETVYAIGFWDADNSGEWDGPTQDDPLGGYGASVDSLEAILNSELGVGGIDFVLDTPYDSTQWGR